MQSRFRCIQLHTLRALVGGLDLDQGDTARSLIVGAVEVQIALVLIGGGQQRGTLGIALHFHSTNLFQRFGICYNKVPAAARSFDYTTASAKVHIIIIYDGGAGGLVTHFFPFQVREPTIADCGGTKIAALGGEIHAAAAVGDGGALVAHTSQVQMADLAAVLLVQRVQTGRTGGAAGAVISTHHKHIAHHDGAGPVEAAGHTLGPCGVFGLCCLVGVFVGDRQANIAVRFGLTVPEAGIDVSVRIGDGREGLSFAGVPIDPQGFQCLGIKCLNDTTIQRAEDHTLGIGGRDSAIACGGCHFTCFCAGSGREIQLVKCFARHDDQAVVHNDRHTGGGGIAKAQLLSPFQRGGFGRLGGAGTGDRHIDVAVAEILPCRSHVGKAAGGRSGECHLNVLISGGGKFLVIGHIAKAGGGVGVGLAA